jgi:hypothetical protein
MPNSLKSVLANSTQTNIAERPNIPSRVKSNFTSKSAGSGKQSTAGSDRCSTIPASGVSVEAAEFIAFAVVRLWLPGPLSKRTQSESDIGQPPVNDQARSPAQQIHPSNSFSDFENMKDIKSEPKDLDAEGTAEAGPYNDRSGCTIPDIDTQAEKHTTTDTPVAAEYLHVVPPAGTEQWYPRFVSQIHSLVDTSACPLPHIVPQSN